LRATISTPRAARKPSARTPMGNCSPGAPQRPFELDEGANPQPLIDPLPSVNWAKPVAAAFHPFGRTFMRLNLVPTVKQG
jgi:hypothetical protein